jgi:hypothetical protein
MGRVVVSEFVSLDGVMEGPGGGEDFEHAGWTFGSTATSSRRSRSSSAGPRARSSFTEAPSSHRRCSSPSSSTSCGLMVFPVLLGSARRLFASSDGKRRMRLTDSRTVGDGVAILIYEPVRSEGAAAA